MIKHFVTAAGAVLLFIMPLIVSAHDDEDSGTPNPPSNLRGEAVSQSQIDLAWEKSTDDDGHEVAGYQIWRDDSKIAVAESNSYQDKTLTAGATYSYFVKAFDQSGNVSERSNTVSVTTHAQTPLSKKPVAEKQPVEPSEPAEKPSFVRRFLPYLASNGESVDYASYKYDSGETNRIGIASLISGILGISLIAFGSLKTRRNEAK